MKIVTILGARPQFIKAGSVSRAIAEHPDITEIIVHTGQHYDANMSDVFFEELQLPKPDYYLGVGSSSHGAMTGRMMEKIEEVVLKEKPDWVMVYGDTNSTLAGALVAAKLHIKLAHIEAGLRSFNMHMPEEINRILTDRVSTVLFCPTQQAVDNLAKEGFGHFDCAIVNSGDVMLDGALFYRQFARKPDFEISAEFVLSTIHRAENTDDPEKLESIVEALNQVNREKQVILPLHPRTRKMLRENNIATEFLTVDPVGYLEMVWLISHSSLVMTDSGGLQKEAFFFRKPCITLREETEWVELLEGGYNTLAGHESSRILDACNSVKEFNENFPAYYGNGEASKIIVDYLVQQDRLRPEPAH